MCFICFPFPFFFVLSYCEFIKGEGVACTLHMHPLHHRIVPYIFYFTFIVIYIPCFFTELFLQLCYSFYSYHYCNNDYYIVFYTLRPCRRHSHRQLS
uniref:Putative secreted peptide n=1 Tax=Anopheles braziliensis TaxID=58242 RepID=A0A2M3ZTX5_9DIPT